MKSLMVVLTSPGGLVLVLIGVMVVGSCRSGEFVQRQYEPDEAHGNYVESLRNLGLADTRMGADWIHAGLPGTNPTTLSLLPLNEVRHFDPGVPDAAYYLIEGIRGQEIDIAIESETGAGFFADLFGLPQDFESAAATDEMHEQWNTLDFARIASGYSGRVDAQGQLHSGGSRILIEPRRHRYYLLRIQPRLLEGGAFNIEISGQASLVWPVEGTGPEDVRSFFGAGRDGGSRVHHGVDIFAPKGTPILAVSDGRVRRVGELELGGKSVSLADEHRNVWYYYAHLDEYGDIRNGELVTTGTVIGYVGNTGNAWGGPDHLHFGIYDQNPREPLDPWYFLVPADVEPPPPILPQELGNLTLGNPVTIQSTLTFFGSPPGNSGTPVSPTVRDYVGKPLQAGDRPTINVTWGDEYTVGPAYSDIRLVALRHDSLGFLFPDRRMRWLPHTANLGSQIASISES